MSLASPSSSVPAGTPAPIGRLGFVGLGAMGLPMAQHLLAHPGGLRVWNRDPAKADSLIAAGATLAASPSDTAEPGGVVFSMVADDAALRAVSTGPAGLVGRLGAGGIHVSCSTVSPDTLRDLARQHAEHGEHLLACPVFGRPDAAAAKKLWVLMAGPAEACARVEPLLSLIGQGAQALGQDHAAAAALKLAGNFMILAAVESIGEAMLMAEQHGVARTDFATFFGRTLFACPIYQNYGMQVAQRRYQPAGFRLRLGLKDMNLVSQAAAQVQVPMPLVDLLRQGLTGAMAKGRGEFDWTGLELGIAEAAGQHPTIPTQT